MRRWLLLPYAVLPLMGCEQQIRLGVEQMVSTIPTILEDNVFANLYRIRENQHAVIAQATLKQSVSNAQNSYDYGIAPYIALRAIAITGLTASGNNSLSYNWQADPINGSLDQRRLQILFGYVARKNWRYDSHADLVADLINIGTQEQRPTYQVDSATKEKMREKTDRERLTDLIASYLPNMPDRINGPIATFDTPDCHSERDFSAQLSLSLKFVCFKGDASLTGHEKADLLVLWSIAIPELSTYLGQSGASKGGSLALTVSANPSSR